MLVYNFFQLLESRDSLREKIDDDEDTISNSCKDTRNKDLFSHTLKHGDIGCIGIGFHFET